MSRAICFQKQKCSNKSWKFLRLNTSVSNFQLNISHNLPLKNSSSEPKRELPSLLFNSLLTMIYFIDHYLIMNLFPDRIWAKQLLHWEHLNIMWQMWLWTYITKTWESTYFTSKKSPFRCSLLSKNHFKIGLPDTNQIHVPAQEACV